jgi:RNA polymerase sigma-54 factor
MRFDTSQHMRLNQQMKLAPRMIQSMEILEMPMLALQERIEQELESNVALELVEPEADSTDEDGRREEPSRDEDAEGDKEMVVGDDDSADDWERLSNLESDYREAFDNEYSSSRFASSRLAGERDRKMDAMANVAARGESLTEQLLHQWTFAEVDSEVAVIGERLIGYIDRDGLLGTDLESILEQNRNIPGVELTIAKFERTLREVQFWLDPPGIAARSMKECLLLQIDALAAEPEADDWTDVRTLIEDHFEDLLQNRVPKIAQRASMSIEGIQRAVEMMRRLKLHPGRDLVDEDVPPIIPDVIVEFDEDADAYVAYTSNGTLPALRINRRYEVMAKDRALDKGTREFVSNSVRNASWLLDSISQRQNTLLRVVNVVLTRQREYCDHGPQYLRPLPMIEVAAQLDIHVGTVSRAVADKWMQTPRGMVPLRMFFSGGTETDSGRDMSWSAVKATLKEIIDNEDKTRPLSDEALAAELKKRGIEIARRTVVKYRQQLDIPPARRRKVFAPAKG